MNAQTLSHYFDSKAGLFYSIQGV